MFGVFSNKDAASRSAAGRGEPPFALRPEFTPTLARMYAAKAATLPKPCRWFCVPTFYRAERPQRGRLREFGQWNCDVIGESEGRGASGDVDVLGVILAAMRGFGLTSEEVAVALNDRGDVVARLRQVGVADDQIEPVLRLLDAWGKLDEAKRADAAREAGIDAALLPGIAEVVTVPVADSAPTALRDEILAIESDAQAASRSDDVAAGVRVDPTIVRGLAYYTGTVFEVIAEGERAVAGGGRYDTLIELFGGPPTPACGFGMGDVVLTNLLDDRGLMPEGAALREAVQRVVRSASLRPEAFVISGGEEHDGLVLPLVAALRRGVERPGFDGKPWDAARYAAGEGGVRPMHARTTDKTTRNLKKLLQDAERQHARFAVIVHGADKVQLKDLDTREDIASAEGDWSVGRESEVYVGREITRRLG
jgi:histidyl-tRNA synthetase